MNTLEDWIPSYSDPDLMRRRPLSGMNTFAKALAEGLKIERACRIVQLEQTPSGWKAGTEDGKVFQGKEVLCTIPMPQFIDLAADSRLSLKEAEQEEIHTVRYERCLSLLAETASPVHLENHGYQRVSSGILDTVISQQQKGISTAPTLTAHATPAFSLEWYDRDRETAATVMRAALQEAIETPILSVSIHGWKFAKPVWRISKPFLKLENGLTLAGDGFEAGDENVPSDLHPRMESAMLSGLQAAESMDV
jgi:predicted NAD/FAD-dependent oxidoreductase